MEEFLTVLVEKVSNSYKESYKHSHIVQYLNRGDEGISGEEHFYSNGRILVEKIKLFCRLIKNNSIRYFKKELSEISELYDLKRNIDGLVLKVTQLKFAAHKERLDFLEFEKNVEISWKAGNITKMKIKQNLTEKLDVYTERYSLRILIDGLENETRKKSIRMKTKLFMQHLKCIRDLQCSRKSDLYHLRFKAKQKWLKQVEKYDSNIEVLYICKSNLLVDKDSIEKQYFIVQDQLIAQRGFYKCLKEERELNAKQAFLTKLECFRRNRAAKIIQRNWRFHSVRASWKKRKGKK